MNSTQSFFAFNYNKLDIQFRIAPFLKPSNLLIFGAATVIYLAILIFQISILQNKSYVLTKADLFTLDSVRMLSRAYIIGKSRAIKFDDETNKTFWISGSRNSAVADFSKLYDTLQYSELVMKIYTDKTGYNNYIDKQNSNPIEVYGIEIGNKSYISLSGVNKNQRQGEITILIFCSVVYCIFLSIHLIRVLRMNKNKQEAPY
jgi:hypothetical protein